MSICTYLSRPPLTCELPASPRNGPEIVALRGPNNVLVSVEIGILQAGG